MDRWGWWEAEEENQMERGLELKDTTIVQYHTATTHTHTHTLSLSFSLSLSLTDTLWLIAKNERPTLSMGLEAKCDNNIHFISI